MSALFPDDRQASLADVAEACALLLPIAQASIRDHDWPPALARWLLQMHDSSRAASAVEAARQSSAPVRHPKASTTFALDGVRVASRVANSVFDLGAKS